VRDYLDEGRQELDPVFLDNAVTQVKTLLVAGTGTTSDTLCFAAMFLSAHSEVVQKMREEHDRVFTKGTEATYDMLCSNPNKLNELEYTTNVIKEVLRFYPIGKQYTVHIFRYLLTLHYRQYSESRN
jgi:cytochrome P450